MGFQSVYISGYFGIPWRHSHTGAHLNAPGSAPGMETGVRGMLGRCIARSGLLSLKQLPIQPLQCPSQSLSSRKGS